ncbi:MAG TPA: iron donor protein CyaY [Candidatus Kapabacteria bacterium]|nr:iron donor protein CyaY [Candidatus Kapabacteria bacterium]
MTFFAQHYDATIRNLEETLAAMIDAGSDFDFTRSGDVLTIEFEDGEKIVITPQSPMEQLWISANYAGHRFNWKDERWVNEKNPSETFDDFIACAIETKT